MSPRPTARTRLVALLGDPVTHSLSPTLQNAAFRAAGVDGVYLALRCDAAAFPVLLRALAAAGGAGNVTIPHKERAAEVVDRRTDAVERTGACNTFWCEGGQVWGDNTDVVGFAHALRELLGGPPTGARILLLGAGGAARAALCALAEADASEVVVLNRTPQRSRALAERFSGAGCRVRAVRAARELRGERFDVVVNATPLGLDADDPLPLATDTDPAFEAALDLVYAPDRTRWVRSLIHRGVPADDGLRMLLHQGAAAFGRWWDTEAPLDAMRAALPARPDRAPIPSASPAR